MDVKFMKAQNRWVVCGGGDMTRAQAEAKRDELNTPTLNLEGLVMTDGYVGSFGKTWETPTEETIEQVIIGAMTENEMTRAQVIEALANGKTLKWGQSPNYYYDHSDAVIGTRRKPREQEMVLCDCGHSVPRDQVMSTSFGTSCPDCYDRMSDYY